jgi:inhibitor of cysteine peptidase
MIPISGSIQRTSVLRKTTWGFVSRGWQEGPPQWSHPTIPALLWVVCVTLAACAADTSGQQMDGPSLGGSSGPLATQTAETIILTENDHDTVVRLPVGGRLVIRLEALPGAGYGWQIARNTMPQLDLLEPSVFEPSKHPGVGGTTTEVFRYIASVSGSGDLELHYRRPWEKEVPPQGIFRVQVIVGEVGRAQ